MSVLASFLAGSAASAGPFYTGGLDSGAGEIDGSGIWIDKALLPEEEQPDWTPVTIAWAVSQNPDGSWRYSYVLSVYHAEISHLVIETSATFTSSDILSASNDFEVGSFSEGPGNPEMPGDIYGIKFNDTTQTTETITFDCWRTPVWGDFYAKNGKAGSTFNTAWNVGLADPDDDPTVGPHDGTEAFHILVPDTFVPEPVSLTLLLVGLPGLLFYARRRGR